MIGRLAILCVVAALGGCQPLPQPFAEHRPPPGAPILTLKDGAGVWVMPLEEAPEQAERLAEALRQAGTPASTNAANRASWRVAGRIENGALVWDVFDPDGAQIGSAPDARRVAALVQEEAPREVAVERPVIAVPLVDGAPGDGPRALARAMTTALRQAQLTVDEKAAQPWIVAGRVALAPAPNRQQHVAIVWELRKPDGEKVYEVKQENEIPAGALDGAWGDVAWAVASAAAEAIVPLIERGGRS